jgi:hypothetical protein
VRIFFKALVLATLSVTACSRCERDNPKPQQPTGPKTSLDSLPPITQTGANTFGCLVDGNAFYSNGCFYTSCQNPLTDPSIGLAIGGQMKRENSLFYYVFSMNARDCRGPGEYVFDTSGATTRLSSYHSVTRPGCQYYSEQTGNYQKGILRVTRYDIPKRILAGTFWLDLYKPGCGDTVRIREGRFDIRFKYFTSIDTPYDKAFFIHPVAGHPSHS